MLRYYSNYCRIMEHSEWVLLQSILQPVLLRTFSPSTEEFRKVGKRLLRYREEQFSLLSTEGVEYSFRSIEVVEYSLPQYRRGGV